MSFLGCVIWWLHRWQRSPVSVLVADAVLVVYNDEKRAIAESLAEAAKRRARAVTLLDFPSVSRHGEEPPIEVADAMGVVDVVFAPTSYSLSQTQARMEATRRGARIASLPTITEEVFTRAMQSTTQN